MNMPPVFSLVRLKLAVLIAALLAANGVSAQLYDFELLNNGAVIANTNDASNDDTAFPSVVKVPDWVAAEDRAAPNANYYMYWGNHSGTAIKLSWAESIDGTWTEYNGDSATGVFDISIDSTRDDYGHISAPDVVIDNVNQRFIMYFHGLRLASSPAPRVHERFVATSGTGLNFNDHQTAFGERGHGPVEVDVLTDSGQTRDVWIGDDYMKTFYKDGRFYGVGKRGVINAAPTGNNIWAQRENDPFGESWDRENTPESNWAELTSGMQDQYHSPATTFLASQEFADHPNNPHGRRIFSNSNDERMNHVDVNLLENDLLEVFFYVRERRISNLDEYNAIYRIVYDVSDDDFQNWTVARDDGGQVLFDVVLTPEDVTAAVVDAVGANYDPSVFADPISFGDTEIFFDDDGTQYLFFSYVSEEFGGTQGEGAITAVRLISPRPVVASIEINNGEAQRSAVESLVIGIDDEVTLAAGAVSVVQRSTATQATFEPVTTNVVEQFIDGQTIVTIQFDSHVRNSEGALVDGNYQLTIDSNLVTNGGLPLSEDFVFGNVESDGFFSFFGDANGNRLVNVLDLLTFRQTYRAFGGDPNYEPFMDFDTNGTVNTVDLLQFRFRFSETLPFTFGSSRRFSK